MNLDYFNTGEVLRKTVYAAAPRKSFGSRLKVGDVGPIHSRYDIDMTSHVAADTYRIGVIDYMENGINANNIMAYDFATDGDIQTLAYQLTNEAIMIKTGSDSEMNSIGEVPSEFINSFANYITLNYFLKGVKTGQDIYTYTDKEISEVDFNILKSNFDQVRHIIRPSNTTYEFYKEDIGYVSVVQTPSGGEQYKIEVSMSYKMLGELIGKMGSGIKKSPSATWVTGIDSYGDLVTKSISIKSIHSYEPVFYPFMKGESIESFSKRYMNSNASILILIGPPGTAKTNFIRQLLQETNESILLTYSDQIKQTDKLFSHFYDSPERFLVVEDAETFIAKRSDGNSNMSQVLNITDGLTANPYKKVIFSVNLQDLNNVDPALLRPGRCFQVLHFSYLKGDDLEKAKDKIGSEFFTDLPIKSGGYTIAELFAHRDCEPIDEVNTNTSSIGFKVGFAP